MADKEKTILATRAWVRTGRPAASVERMFDDEIEQLAALVDGSGKPVSGFKQKMDAFLGEYFDRRKANEDEPKSTEA